jgi:glycosyltransferase involved in cell wall biosynthesis
MEDGQPVKISVVVPCYNGERYLVEALDSIEAQTFPPHEVILIDDGSTDGSRSIAKEFPDVQVVRNSKNMGAFLSSDDVWDPRFLEMAHWRISRVEATYTDYFRVGPDGNIMAKFMAPKWSEDEVIAWALRKNMFVNFSTVVFPKNIRAKFEPKMRHGEDIIFLLDTLAIGIKWGRIARPLVSYRVHPAMGSRTQTRAEYDLTWSHIQIRLESLGVDNDVILRAYERHSYRTYGLIPRLKRGIKRVLK